MSDFKSLGILDAVLDNLTSMQYNTPTPVQSQSIPKALAGHDLLVQAQTGTGKTAAFALPILSRISIKQNHTQALILAPTRELAIQISDAMQRYAKNINGLKILPLFGGRNYREQLKALKQGAQVVIGTPGRTMDFMRRGMLSLDHLQTMVLDEADEMLKMGFIDDVTWILEQAPEQHQLCLYSATVPPAIQKIAKKYLKNPEHIHIKSKTKTADSIEQFYTSVKSHQKINALIGFLEMEKPGGKIIFTRTRSTSTLVAEQLSAAGFKAASINGDMKQNDREKVIAKIKNHRLDIVVATEVAARGLDVDRIDLVVNYDIPQNVDLYIHRIGRTGRAGRTGKSITFILPREKHELKQFERFTKQKILPLNPPSTNEIQEKRFVTFSKQVHEKLSHKQHAIFKEKVQKLTDTLKTNEIDLSAALMMLAYKTVMPAFTNTEKSSKPSVKLAKKKPFSRRSDHGKTAKRRHKPQLCWGS